MPICPNLFSIFNYRLAVLCLWSWMMIFILGQQSWVSDLDDDKTRFISASLTAFLIHLFTWWRWIVFLKKPFTSLLESDQTEPGQVLSLCSPHTWVLSCFVIYHEAIWSPNKAGDKFTKQFTLFWQNPVNDGSTKSQKILIIVHMFCTLIWITLHKEKWQTSWRNGKPPGILTDTIPPNNLALR